MTETKIDELKFISLGDAKQVSLAIGEGLLRGDDSPKGYLCTLCGAMIANQEMHIRYHSFDYLVLEAVHHMKHE